MKAATPWLAKTELLVQLAAVFAPSVVPQYTVTVGFSPPVTVTFPFKVAADDVMLVAALKVMVGRAIVVVKLKEAVGQVVPAELVALAEK